MEGSAVTLEWGSGLLRDGPLLRVSGSCSGLLAECLGVTLIRPFSRTAWIHISKFFPFFLGELHHHCEVEPGSALELGIQAPLGMRETFYKNEECSRCCQDPWAKGLEQLEFMGGSRW